MKRVMMAAVAVVGLAGCVTVDSTTAVTSKYGTVVVVTEGTNKVTVTTALNLDQVVQAVGDPKTLE